MIILLQFRKIKQMQDKAPCALGNFADGIFAVGKFCRRDILPYGYFDI